MTEIWYQLSLSENGNPICYLKDFDYLSKLQGEGLEIEKIDHRPAQLEFIVKTDGETKGSFKLESHAFRYNLEKLDFKGEIEPNPQEAQLKLDL